MYINDSLVLYQVDTWMKGIMMTELNMQTVRDTVIDYVSNGNTVPTGMSAEAYTEAQYDMDTLCDDLYDACEAAGVGPDELDADEFVGLLEKHDTGAVVEVDIMHTARARQFGFGISAVLTDDIDTGAFYDPADDYVRLNMYINKAMYGEPGHVLQGRVSAFAEGFTDDRELNKVFLRASAKGSEEPFHAFLEVGSGYFDLTDECVYFDDIAEPEMDVMWYHDGKREIVTIPIEIVEDDRL